MNFSPIIIFVYNRLHHLDRLFNSLQRNDLFKKSKVLIFSDGPKNQIDKDKIDKVRKLLKERLIPQNSEIIENDVNLGLSRNVIGGLNKTFQIYDRAIILEDDLELSPFFLNYINDALNLYATSENVASISGYMYPIEPKKFSNNYFFLKLIESWGWGTWKRAWNIFENDSLQLKKKIDVCCINMSCGYYNMHSNQEFVSIEDVENSIVAGLNMVKELGYKKYKYEYKPIVYTPQTVMNSLVKFMDDEDEDYPVHQLESVDVLEEKDGITISDVFQGDSLFISDDDIPYLYEILKERLISKY